MIALLFLALISDIRTFKIKNKIVFPFMLIGILTNVVLHGQNGLVLSLKGLIIPLLLLFILYVPKMLGAGDIKLFGAIGAIMGMEFVLYSMAYSFLWGGAIAILIMTVNRNGRHRLIYFLKYLKACFLTFSILPYTSFEDKEKGVKFRFAYAIAFGTLTKLALELGLISL